MKAFTLAAVALASLMAAPPGGAKELKLATLATEGSVWADMTQRFVDRLAEVSGGELKIVPYWGSQLGNQQETLNMMLRGRLDIWMGPGSSFGILSPESNALGLPYIFRDEAHTVCVMEKVDDELDALIAPRGHVLGYYPNSFVDIAAKEALRAPEEYAGVKVRTGAQDVAIGFWTEVGAQAVPMSIGEMNQALATNLVRAGEQVTHYYAAIATNSVAPYYIETNHYYNIGAIVMSNRSWKALGGQEQAWVTEAAEYGFDFATEVQMMADSRDAVKEGLKAKGVTFVELTEEERAPWRKVGLESHAPLIAKFNDSTMAFYETVLAAANDCAPE